MRLLEPFSSKWFYGDVLFIIDVWLWLLMGAGLWVSRRREKRGGEGQRLARIVGSVALAYIGVNAAITGIAERTYSFAPVDPGVVIASPRPVISWSREMIFGNEREGWAVGTRRIGNTPLSACDLDAARVAEPQVDAFLFWSRAPVIERRDDGRYLLTDARYFDIRERQFSTIIPSRYCEPSR